MNKKKFSPREIAGEAVKWLPQIKKLRKKNRGEEKEFAEKRKGAPWARKTKNVKKLRVKSVCELCSFNIF